VDDPAGQAQGSNKKEITSGREVLIGGGGKGREGARKWRALLDYINVYHVKKKGGGKSAEACATNGKRNCRDALKHKRRAGLREEKEKKRMGKVYGEYVLRFWERSQGNNIVKKPGKRLPR